MTLQKTWQDIFQAETQEECEKNARACGHEFFEWGADSSLKVTSVAQNPVHYDERTSRHVWFNAVALLHPASHPEVKREDAPWTVVYADTMEEIGDDDIHLIMRVLAEEDRRVLWQANDAICVDNVSCMHARASFEPPRLIWTTMFGK